MLCCLVLCCIASPPASHTDDTHIRRNFADIHTNKPCKFRRISRGDNEGRCAVRVCVCGNWELLVCGISLYSHTYMSCANVTAERSQRMKNTALNKCFGIIFFFARCCYFCCCCCRLCVPERLVLRHNEVIVLPLSQTFSGG